MYGPLETNISFRFLGVIAWSHEAKFRVAHLVDPPPSFYVYHLMPSQDLKLKRIRRTRWTLIIKTLLSYFLNADKVSRVSELTKYMTSTLDRVTWAFCWMFHLRKIYSKLVYQTCWRWKNIFEFSLANYFHSSRIFQSEFSSKLMEPFSRAERI